MFKRVKIFERGNRNGTIELLRVIMSVMIALGHWGYVQGAYLVVEFFFIISGYYMCVSSKKDEMPIGKGTWLFIKRKALRVIPYVYTTYLIVFFFTYVVAKKERFFELIHIFSLQIWELLFCTITGLGISNYLLGVTWYISAMLIGMAILYPLLRKFSDVFYNIIAPLAFLFLLGYLSWRIGNLRVVYSDTGHTYFAFIRSMAGLFGGCLCYNIVECIDSINFNKKGKLCITIIEWIFWLGINIAIKHYVKTNYDFVIVVMFIIACSISLSELSYTGIILNRRIVYWGGNLSLPFYLCHVHANAHLHRYYQFTLKQTFVLTCLISIIIYFLAKIGEAIILTVGRFTKRMLID